MSFYLDSNNFIVLNKFIPYLHSMLLFYKLFGKEWKRRYILFAYFSWLNDVIVYKEEEQKKKRSLQNEENIFGRMFLFSFLFFFVSTATINFSAVNPSKNSSSWWNMSLSISYIFHMMKYIFQRVYSSKMRKKIAFRDTTKLSRSSIV